MAIQESVLRRKTRSLISTMEAVDRVFSGVPMNEFVLNVPYYSQRDNTEEWWRTCNSSSCAMVAEYLKPGCVHGSDDYYYTHHVLPHGDTTDHSVQTIALKELGIDSEFHYNLDYGDIDASLKLGYPVVLGVLHKGCITQPAGGHMIVVIGQYKGGYVVNDPWGEGFSYENTHGERVHYPLGSLDARWLTDGIHTGWGRIIKGVN